MPSAAAPHSTASTWSTVGVLTWPAARCVVGPSRGPGEVAGCRCCSVLSRFYPSEEGKTRLMGCCLPSTKLAVQSVPRVITKGGPCDEDHLNPLGVDGSLNSLTSTLCWSPLPVLSWSSRALVL